MLLSKQPAALKMTFVVILTAACTVLFLYHLIRPFDHRKEAIISGQEPLPLQSPILASAAPNPIPERLWYKLGPKGLSDESQEWIKSCLETNPMYRAEYMTDESAEMYVKVNFATRPEIVETYLALPFPILKADFFRYLILFAEGGIWNDLDVSCGDVPIADWIPAQYAKEANLVVGWEFDVGWGDSFEREFATWTIMARPGSPHLLLVIESIVQAFREKSREHDVAIAELTMDMIGDVVDSTGPRRMTHGIMDSLKSNLQDDFSEESTYLLMEPMLVGDVLILPGYSLAASSNHYEEGVELPPAFVTHHFASSWKNENFGEGS